MHHLTARLTADATVKTFESGRSVVNFRVAENESYKTKAGEKRIVTRYYDCAYWITPKIAQYLTKGKLIEMIGSVEARAYAGKDGTPKATLQMNASKIVFHSKAKKEDSEASNAPHSNATAVTDDLPF
nr:single-stranded DNA-binding protein [Pedobacter sp. ASV19]